MWSTCCLPLWAFGITCFISCVAQQCPPAARHATCFVGVDKRVLHWVQPLHMVPRSASATLFHR